MEGETISVHLNYVRYPESCPNGEWMHCHRAGAAGTAGTVLAVPLFSHLTISRHGPYSRGEKGITWWCSIDVNVVHACSSKRLASCSIFIVSELPPTPQLSARFVFP